MGIEAKISSKGQTTIPAEVREKLGLQTGDRIAFIEMEQGYLIIPRNRPVDVLFGALDLAVGEGVSNHVEGLRKG